VTPSPLNSILSAALLGGADLGLLAWATAALGARPSTAKLVLLSLGVFLKLALLGLGFAWLCRQDWFLKPWGMGGVLAPFAVFLLWQLFLLQRHAAAKTAR
jgi:hypothetical protein